MNNKNSLTYRVYKKNKLKLLKQSMVFVGVYLVLILFFGFLPAFIFFKIGFKNIKYDFLLLEFWCFLLLIIFAFLFERIKNWFDNKINKNYFTWGRGAGAELFVIKKLEEFLGNDYKIVEDIQNSKGNVDVVCVGPTGIFVIEVKAHKGLIVKDWCQKYLKQLCAEVSYIKSFLKDVFKKEYLVEGILEFPFGRVDKKSIDGRINNFIISEGQFFIEFIKNRKTILSVEEICKIYHALLHAKHR